MSLFTGLRYPKKLAAIAALSCYLPTKDQLPSELSSANKSTAILQHHGKLDEVVPMSAGEVAHKLLKAEGYQTQWKTYSMAHSVLPQQLDEIGAWLKNHLIE